MKSRIFEIGGGAGIGSYIVVMKNGALVNPNPLRIRQEFDAGNTLFLSILDDTTQQALIQLTGYVDTEDKLHLTCRDFDDVKTYDLTVEGEQPVVLTPTDGVTIGDSVVAMGGSGGSQEVLADLQVVVREGHKYWVFPKNVYPISYYNDDYGNSYFPDYRTDKLYKNSDGKTECGSTQITNAFSETEDDFRVVWDMTSEGCLNDPSCDSVIYVLMDLGASVGGWNSLDSWSLFFPQQGSSGFDTDILSQLVWTHDNNKTQILFPEHVLPLRFSPYNYYTCYFKYDDKIIYDGDNPSSATGLGSITIENNRVKLSFTKSSGTNFGPDESDTLDYILQDGSLWQKANEMKNTYNLYNPSTGGGTQLYKHNMYIGGERFYIISTYANSYQPSDFAGGGKDISKDYISAGDQTMNPPNVIAAINYDSGTDKLYLSYTDDRSGDIEGAADDWDDTVTAL